MILLQLATVVLIFRLCLTSTTGLEVSNGTSAQDLNGQVLIDMGINLNKPLIQLLGKTIRNVEERAVQRTCDLHPCTEWTDWSRCFAKFNNFGAKERTRTCGRSPTTCLFDSSNRTEEDSQICIGVCSDNYNMTKNGFCIKLYKNGTTSQSEAEKQCVADGGHLINIDSERKNEDVNQFVLTESFTYGFWINGQRNDPNSPWKYRYGSSDPYIKWYSGYPKNATNNLCLMVGTGSNTRLGWYDQPCSTGYNYMCEII